MWSPAPWLMAFTNQNPLFEMTMETTKAPTLWDVIEQELDERIADSVEYGEPIEINDEERSRIVYVIDKYIGEMLTQQITNALF